MITVPSVLAALAGSPRTAGVPAVVTGAVSVTFAELYERGLRRVGELGDHGVTDGSVVAVVGYNEPAVFEYLVAAGHLGAALMPLSPAMPDTDLTLLLEKSEAAVCLCSPSLDPARVLALATVGRPTVVIGEPDGPAPAAPGFPAADATCWVSTTGGSTGTPRLFAMSHERLLTNLVVNAVEWGWRDYRAHLALAPLAHGIGFSHAVGQLATGGTVVLVERYSAAVALDAARREGPCWTAIVPTMVHDLLEVGPGAEPTSRRAPEPRCIVSAGAPLSRDLRERVLGTGRRLIEYYGSTELGWVTWTEHRPGDPRDAVVGTPTLGTQVRVLGPDGRPAPRGVPGRIEKRGRPYAIPLAGGPSAYRANAAAWESSGDLGYVDDDGALVLAGREDDMLVVGGQNVYPVEVEAALRAHPGVREALVRGEPSERLGRRVVAFVEPVPGVRLDAAELGELCAGRLAKYKRPSRITVLAALPRNPAGKLARTASLG